MTAFLDREFSLGRLLLYLLSYDTENSEGIINKFVHNLYFSDAFIEIIASVYKLRLLPVSKNLGCPVFISKLNPRQSAFVLPFGFYQTSGYFINLGVESTWATIRDFSYESNINISLSSIGELSIDNSSYIANNPVLDLSLFNEDLTIFSKNHRQNIRKERNKALRNEIVIKSSMGCEELHGFYDVLAKQYVEDHKMVFQPFSLYSQLLLRGFARLIVAKRHGKVIGGIFCIQDGDVLHYNWGARTTCANVNIGTLLIDYAVRSAAADGYRYFDFGSTPLSDDDLFNFKMKWGCENHKVYKYCSLRAIKEIDLNESYGLLRSLYSKTPVPIAKAAMPFVVPLLVC